VSKIFAWVNSDLDGVGTAVLLSNIFKNFEYRNCFFGNFEEQYLKWSKEFANEYDLIFIVGMVLDQSIIKKIDRPNVTIVNDRADALRVYDSTLIEQEYSSCTKLLYNKLKNRYDFPKNVKRFVLYVDDYNSYALKHEETKYLNALYRKTGYDRFNRFVKRFYDGFDGFTDSEIELAESFFKELQDELDKIDIYKGVYNGSNVLSTISKFSVNELAHSILTDYVTDVVIVLNPDTQFVSFRKSPNSTADVAKMAKELCDGGGGKWTSGGKITKEFLKFSQELEKI
jgi:oligoribonuclease NrnB/cAMP/cGMP phosphodiesterase (DHH superfamily)